MHKQNKIHLIYAIILIVVVSTSLFFNDYQLKNAEQNLKSSISANAKEIIDIKNLFEGKITDLENKNSDLLQSTQNIEKNLQSSIEASDKQLKDLSSEISSVQKESKDNIGSLEKSIAGIKVSASDFSDIIDASISGVVSVQTNKGAGSGFIVREDGYIVTNKHVIEGATQGLILTSSGDKYSVGIVGMANNIDIAVLKIDANGLNTLKWANSNDIKVGEKAIAIGNPGGLDFSVSQGIVSSTKRDDGKGNQLIQIDVPINPGNSGGPLINSQGKVMGVNTLKLAGFENVGFALASNDVKSVVNDIISKEN